MWFDCVERKRLAKFPLSTTAPRAFAATPSFQACLRAFICTFCMCLCILCVCVHVWTCIYVYIYACVYVFVHLCVYTHVHVYVYAYLCMDCGSWYQCFSVWTVSCMRMCFRVHMYAYAYCVGIYICEFLCSECYMHFTGVLGTSAWAGVYVTQVCFTPTYTSANTLAAGCAHMCICIYVCICMHMHMDAYVCL